MRQLFSVKANRDAAFKAAGGTKAGLKKTSLRNQYLNPKYVADSGVTGQTTYGDDLSGFSVLYSWSKEVTHTPAVQIYTAPPATTLIERPTFGTGGFKRIK